ncbi:MAG: ATP-binding protein [Acidimicrobiales bacterium]
MADKEVRLVVPARPEYLRLARMLAAAVGSRAGLTLDEIDDLRIAIDEVMFAAVGPDGGEGQVALTFRLEATRIEVIGRSVFADGVASRGRPTALSDQILRAVLDEYSISPEPDGASFRLVKAGQGI